MAQPSLSLSCDVFLPIRMREYGKAWSCIRHKKGRCSSCDFNVMFSQTLNIRGKSHLESKYQCQKINTYQQRQHLSKWVMFYFYSPIEITKKYKYSYTSKLSPCLEIIQIFPHLSWLLMKKVFKFILCLPVLLLLMSLPDPEGNWCLVDYCFVVTMLLANMILFYNAC